MEDDSIDSATHFLVFRVVRKRVDVCLDLNQGANPRTLTKKQNVVCDSATLLCETDTIFCKFYIFALRIFANSKTRSRRAKIGGKDCEKNHTLRVQGKIKYCPYVG